MRNFTHSKRVTINQRENSKKPITAYIQCTNTHTKSRFNNIINMCSSIKTTKKKNDLLEFYINELYKYILSINL